MNMPSLVSVDSARLQPTFGLGSRVSDRPSNRATHASNVRCVRRAREGPSVITHNQAGVTRGAHPERTQSRSLTMLCWEKNGTRPLAIGRENGSQSLTALGKKRSKNFQIAPLRTRPEVDAEPRPASTGRPACKISSLVSNRVPARWQPQRITRAGTTALETTLCTVEKTPFRMSPCYLALNHATFQEGPHHRSPRPETI